MRILLLSTMLLLGTSFSPTTEAKPFYRFWRGWKKESMTPATFQGAINQIFVPATVAAGAGLGLKAYIPTLRPEGLANTLPDELALVVYESKEKYDQFKSTPEGQAYSNLHWDYFSKELGSSSKVPESFTGQLESEHAYDLLETEVEWQRGFVSINYAKASMAPNQYVQTVRDSYKTQGLNGYLVLMADGYFIEYTLWDKEQSYQKAIYHLSKLRKQAGLESHAISSTKMPSYQAQLQWGQALNVSFDQRTVARRDINPEQLLEKMGCSLDGVEREHKYIETLEFDRLRLVMECEGYVLYHGGERIDSSFMIYTHLIPTYVGNAYYMIGVEHAEN